MATWPATLPAALIEGRAAQVVLPASRPDFGLGWTTPRRRATNLPQRVSASWVLSPDQARDLTLFARDHAGEWATISIRLPGESEPTTAVLARFAGALAMTSLSRYWRAAVDLEIAP